METIISYLKKQYQPVAMILYGSYADGSNNKNSDFDALLIAADGDRCHDTSFVEGIQLDVFVYPLSEFENEIDYDEFIQIYDGKVLVDTDDIGNNLKKKVLEYLDNLPAKSANDIQTEIEWCKKMLSRVERMDAEGYFRWHWLLIDSLEILFDIMQQPYRGPKKSIRWLKENRPELYDNYNRALQEMKLEALETWVDCMTELYLCNVIQK